MTVHRAVGHLINFYNVQFYNQVDTRYDTYAELFTNATGGFSNTSVNEIIARGVPSDMVVVTKPATPADASNTGYMDPTLLGQAVTRAYNELHWHAGVAFWQYYNDINGTILQKAAGNLIDLCKINQDCN
jgi:hypothetical protein